jgi:hypothetical protein
LRRVWKVRGSVREPLQPHDPEIEIRPDWGRPGPRTRDLARAILLDTTRNPLLAKRLAALFTWKVLAELPEQGFRLSRREVMGWTERGQLEEEAPARSRSTQRLVGLSRRPNQ